MPAGPKTDWNPLLRDQFEEPYWRELQAFLRAERHRHEVYPADDEVFAALHLTPPAEGKVLSLRQDPYHGPGQAPGPCFSVPDGVQFPTSTVNIHPALAPA